jgi:glycosyltransferase involved in cell wall biosynthesis
MTAPGHRVTAIVPCFNEAATVRAVVQALLASGHVQQIVVVDDGSADASVEQLAGLPITLVRHDRNQGKGAAIRSALPFVDGDVVAIQDADLEYAPSDLGRVLKPFEEAAVIAVYGSRNLVRNPRSSVTFHWGGIVLSWWTNWLYGSALTDITTGCKAVRTTALRQLALASNGFEFCAETTGRLLAAGVEIHEVPISYRPRTWAEGKKITVRDGWIAARTLWSARPRRRLTPAAALRAAPVPSTGA